MDNIKIRDYIINNFTDDDEETAVAKAMALPKIANITAGKNIVKVIYKPGKILNLIVK